jgi:hypothetical protein
MSYQSTPSNSTPDGTPRLRLPDQVRKTIRRKHYGRHTEEAYIYWIKRFINSSTIGIPRQARRKSPHLSAIW